MKVINGGEPVPDDWEAKELEHYWPEREHHSWLWVWWPALGLLAVIGVNVLLWWIL